MLRTPITDGWQMGFVRGPVPESIPARIPATVPGSVHTDLLAEGLIPEPFLDRNEDAVQWIGRSDVRYEVDLDIDRHGHERIDLVCEGLDTVATVELDGVLLGTTRNQHRSYRFDLRDALGERGRHEEDGQHRDHLSVTFASALEEAEAASVRLGPRPVVGNAYPYNALRKMACNFGWDWGPVLITAGIWKPIMIEAWSTARLDSVRPVVTVDEAGGHVAVHLAVERTGGAALTADIEVSDPSGVRVATAHQELTGDDAVTVLDVADPDLWWPRGHGAQPLYRVSVVLRSGDDELDRWTRAIGFRTVRLAVTPDEIGTGVSLEVNGSPIWVKGANWIPDDTFPTRVTPERYARGIADATDAGMNLLRVWGGGIYERDEFYDICDREGLLVWQDFTLACAAYSEDPELWDEIEAEARENVVRLAPHPALVVWNGGNENVEGYWHWGWKEALAEGEAWGNGYYEGLFPEILAELDPTRAYVPSSPFNPRDPSLPRDPDNGTVHEWEVWNRQDYTHYRANIPRFVAEFGFQGPPAFSTITRWITDQPLAPDSPGILAHQKADDGAGKLQRGLGAHLPEPADFDDWHFATQLNQARAITYGIEHFRSHAPRTTGSIIWQLNDCWPVASWAAVDSDHHRKPLWYALRSVNAERLATVQPRDGVPTLVLSDDSPTAWQETVEVVRVRFDGEVLARQSVVADVAPWSTVTIPLDEDVVRAGDPSAEVVVVTSASARRAFWYFAEDPALALPPLDVRTSVSRTDDGYDVAVTAAAFVKDLVLSPDRLDPSAAVDDMLLTLLPGETATIRVTTGSDLDADALTRHPVLNSVNGLLRRSRTNSLGAS